MRERERDGDRKSVRGVTERERARRRWRERDERRQKIYRKIITIIITIFFQINKIVSILFYCMSK